MDWEAVDDLSTRTATTYNELFELDELYRQAKLGDTWMVSKRRAEILRGIRGRAAKMSDVEGVLPKELFRTYNLTDVNGKRLPLTVYPVGGGRRIAGEAVLSETEEGVIAKIELSGDEALDILQHGTKAFSIGFPTVDIEDSNLQPPQRPSRWERRQRKTRAR